MVSCIMKLMQTNQSVTRDIHHPRMQAAHNSLSKAEGCLWHSLVNWEDKMLRVENLASGPSELANVLLITGKTGEGS